MCVKSGYKMCSSVLLFREVYRFSIILREFSNVFLLCVFLFFFWFSRIYWGHRGGGRSMSTKVLTVSSGSVPGGPGGGWARRACSHRLGGALGSCRMWLGWSWVGTWCRGWVWAGLQRGPWWRRMPLAPVPWPRHSWGRLRLSQPSWSQPRLDFFFLNKTVQLCCILIEVEILY